MAYLDGPRTKLVLNIDRWSTSSNNMNIYPLNFSRAAYIEGDMKLILNEYDNQWFTPLTRAEWDEYGQAEFVSIALPSYSYFLLCALGLHAIPQGSTEPCSPAVGEDRIHHYGLHTR